MKQYKEALELILKNGTRRDDRTGVGTIGIFGMQQRYDLSKGFPAVTTKQLYFKSVVAELLWMIEGSGDDRRLSQIQYGDTEHKTIWTANAMSESWVKKNLKRAVGDLGRIYGVQWRRWRKPLIRINKVALQNHDQLLALIEGIKTDPYSRRHIITAWNPGELELMALPPCHCFAQFYVVDGKLSCQMYQRSADMFLGVPFNIASYSLFTHLIAQACNLEVGEFIHTIGDAHIYINHIEQVKELLTRDPLPLPQVKINPNVNTITGFTIGDIELVDYQHHPAIKAEMAV
jgi:thymidylate synthase